MGEGLRLAIFDVDGTLVDSGGTIHRALEQSLAAHGHACPPRADAQQVIGLSLEQAMARLVPEGDHLVLADSYKQAFIAMREKGEVEEELFPDVDRLLDRLEADGWLLGIATGKSDKGLEHLLRAHGWEKRFVSRHTADRHPSKPHPSMVRANLSDTGVLADHAVMIGDTSFDIEMGVNAGVSAIGVAWGYHGAQALEQAGARSVARNCDELMEMVERWTSDAK